jgi:hypothetical protein
LNNFHENQEVPKTILGGEKYLVSSLIERPVADTNLKRKEN